MTVRGYNPTIGGCWACGRPAGQPCPNLDAYGHCPEIGDPDAREPHSSLYGYTFKGVSLGEGDERQIIVAGNVVSIGRNRRNPWPRVRKTLTALAFVCVPLMGMSGALAIATATPQAALAALAFMFAAVAFEIGAWLAGILERR